MSTLDLIIVLLVVGIVVIAANLINLNRSKKHRKRKVSKPGNYY